MFSATTPTHPHTNPTRQSWVAAFPRLVGSKSCRLSKAYLGGWVLCACPAATVSFLNKWPSWERRGYRLQQVSASHCFRALLSYLQVCCDFVTTATRIKMLKMLVKQQVIHFLPLTCTKDPATLIKCIFTTHRSCTDLLPLTRSRNIVHYCSHSHIESFDLD